MFKDLKGKFNRATVNHPRKVFLGGGITAGNGIGLLTLPFDGGFTLVLTTILSGTAALGEGILSSQDESMFTSASPEDHRTYTTLEHLGTTYRLTKAQNDAYNKAKREIEECKAEFDSVTYAHKKKLIKKAQKLADFQQDIINGATPANKVAEEPQLEFKIEHGRNKKGRTKGIPKN